MKKTSTDSPSNLDRIRSWAHSKAHGPSPLTAGSRRPSVLPISNSATTSTQPGSVFTGNTDTTNVPPFPSTDINGLARQSSKPTANNVADNISNGSPPPAPPPEADGEGAVISQEKPKKVKKNIAVRFFLTLKSIIFSSWINVLLIFVPVGIAVEVAHLNPTIIFAMNAIAIIPLAGLLSHATESVAKRMGDTIGALMNVTFGNAVELIIFIALVQNEVRIVQASLLGSILANLLLILGMCFLVGGLRFREQIYNSTVTQMSACLLSLSVMSLLLPTAFHASFDSSTVASAAKATVAVLQVSRGTSVILLLVYGLYLLFQLKSHAYMYESTPQHIIDEESAPGPVAAWMDTSSSDDSSSSSSDSDNSNRSNTTAGRIKRVMRGGRRRRKSSAGSKETAEPHSPIATRTASYNTGEVSPTLEHPADGPSSPNPGFGHRFGAIIDPAEDADTEGAQNHISRSHSIHEKQDGSSKKDRKHKKKRHDKKKAVVEPIEEKPSATGINEKLVVDPNDPNEPRRVDFAITDLEAQTERKPFTIGGLNLRPAMSKTFSQNVFTQPSRTGSPQIPVAPSGPIPRVRYGIRRTNSLPDRLNQMVPGAPTLVVSTSLTPVTATQRAITEANDDEEENISRTTAVILLLVSTGLVALCAEFMVSSISSVTQNTALGETFVGLIILPIVGNAAEHVTAVTVANKNKMDLAIGVAVGSSIQIALFVTPFVVLLGWAMNVEMTLYFTLFETVSLFVSAFIVNFLVLDGRSNYLEGALLVAAYVIIAVAAFFYPTSDCQSSLGGNPDASVKMIRDILNCT